MLADFSLQQSILIGLIFIWTGFVRSGLGFGGAALGLPLMLFIDERPVFWLPIIGFHLLFFSALTLRTRLNNVDWAYLRRASLPIIPAAVVGVLGLIKLPNQWLVYFVYSITLFYAGKWLLNIAIHSSRGWIDRLLLITGGYVAGTTLSGAPLMVAVFVRNIAPAQLRNTMFVLWFILVTIKMTTFAILEVPLNFLISMSLLPIAAIGHMIGLKFHDRVLQNDLLFKRVLGAMLMVISILGLWQIR